MNLYDFEKGINMLREVFGHKVYPQERTTVLMKELKNVDGNVFLRAINAALLNDKHPPLLNELREHIRRVTEDLKASGNNLQKQLRACNECEQRGYFFMTDDAESITFVASCPHCEFGRYLSWEAPHKIPPMPYARKKGYRIQKQEDVKWKEF